MVGLTLKREQEILVRRLRNEELLEDVFEYIIQLRDESDRELLTDTIQLYFDVDIFLEDINKLMRPEDFDPDKINEINDKISEKSITIGAAKVIEACKELDLASKSKYYVRCMLAFNNLKKEYHTLRDYLEEIYKLENLILDREDELNGVAGTNYDEDDDESENGNINGQNGNINGRDEESD